jgi:hypothetical protein
MQACYGSRNNAATTAVDVQAIVYNGCQLRYQRMEIQPLGQLLLPLPYAC